MSESELELLSNQLRDVFLSRIPSEARAVWAQAPSEVVHAIGEPETFNRTNFDQASPELLRNKVAQIRTLKLDAAIQPGANTLAQHFEILAHTAEQEAALKSRIQVLLPSGQDIRRFTDQIYDSATDQHIRMQEIMRTPIVLSPEQEQMVAGRMQGMISEKPAASEPVAQTHPEKTQSTSLANPAEKMPKPSSAPTDEAELSKMWKGSQQHQLENQQRKDRLRKKPPIAQAAIPAGKDTSLLEPDASHIALSPEQQAAIEKSAHEEFKRFRSDESPPPRKEPFQGSDGYSSPAAAATVAETEGAFAKFMKNEKWMGKKGLAIAGGTVLVGGALYLYNQSLAKKKEGSWVEKTSADTNAAGASIT